MTEYSYRVIYLPRGMPRDDARRILTDQAEYGQWELARMRLNADGSRKAILRRQIIRPGGRPVAAHLSVAGSRPGLGKS